MDSRWQAWVTRADLEGVEKQSSVMLITPSHSANAGKGSLKRCFHWVFQKKRVNLIEEKYSLKEEIHRKFVFFFLFQVGDVPGQI